MRDEMIDGGGVGAGVRPDLAATTDLAHAAATRWDVLVVGAGPAGAMAALLMAREGLSTLLVDRRTFPRHKVCGCCVNARAVALLERVGLTGELQGLGGRPLRAIRLVHERRRVDLPLPGGMAVSRAALDGMLVRAAIAAGAEFMPATAASLSAGVASPASLAAGVGSPASLAIGVASPASDPERSMRGDRRCASLVHRVAGKAEAFASVVIAADGLGHPSLGDGTEFRSRIAPAARIGIGGLAGRPVIAAPSGTITMAIGNLGYVGVVEVERGRTIVAAALDAAHVRNTGGPAAAVAAILAEAGVPVDGAALGQVDWTGTIALTRKLERPVGERLFVLGDAAGYVEPFTGEGIAWAFASAQAVVPFVHRALTKWNASLEHDWLATRRSQIESQQRWCRALARVLRHPAAVRTAIAALRWRPELARPVLAHVVGPSNTRG